MKMFYEYIVFFFNLSPKSNHDEDANGKFRIERVKEYHAYNKYENGCGNHHLLWNSPHLQICDVRDIG